MKNEFSHKSQYTYNNEMELHCIHDMQPLIRIGINTVMTGKSGKILEFPKLQCPLCKINYTVLRKYSDKQIVRLDGTKYININPYCDNLRYQNHLSQAQTPTSNCKCYVHCYRKMRYCHFCKRDLAYRKVKSKDPYRMPQIYSVMYCNNCDLFYLNYGTYEINSEDWIVENADELSKIKNKWKSNILNNSPTKKSKKSKKLDSNSISVKDFVVRKNTFKCRHSNHELQNIDAIISVINNDGDMEQCTITAGYCPNCNIYFIMESTYQKLKARGTLVCRISDEKAYLNNNEFLNGSHLAQESILMQYGYTVSKIEKLSSERRHKILTLIVDNHVLTKSEIISYLNFFINQKKYQSKYEKAISKWESDRDFITSYKTGSYSKYGVGRLFRKH